MHMAAGLRLVSSSARSTTRISLADSQDLRLSSFVLFDSLTDFYDNAGDTADAVIDAIENAPKEFTGHLYGHTEDGAVTNKSRKCPKVHATVNLCAYAFS